MSATQQSERVAPGSDPSTPHRFRAPTVEEALRRAREVLGDDVEIIEASRIRRGGIGGFFATELGVEVLALATEAPDAEATVTLEPALGRATAVEPAASPRRGRQAWRNATRDDTLDDQRMIPALEQMLDRADASERAVASSLAPAAHPTAPATMRATVRATERATDTPRNEQRGVAAVTGTPESIDTAPMGSFAEHFLRELVQDAQGLHRSAGRNRMLPASRLIRPDGMFADEPVHAEEVPAEPAPRRRRRPRVTSSATGPISDPELPGIRVASPPPTDPAKSADALAVVGTAGSGTPTMETVAPDADPAAQPAVDTGTATTALTEIVDRCVQFATAADRSTAPRKLALAITMNDGGVMKVTVELPRSR